MGHRRFSSLRIRLHTTTFLSWCIWIFTCYIFSQRNHQKHSSAKVWCHQKECSTVSYIETVSYLRLIVCMISDRWQVSLCFFEYCNYPSVTSWIHSSTSGCLSTQCENHRFKLYQMRHNNMTLWTNLSNRRVCVHESLQLYLCLQLWVPRWLQEQFLHSHSKLMLSGLNVHPTFYRSKMLLLL